uniref:Uncharacterized protein n=1 Tax=Oryza rufipogon TaxID=4529 RepID=A0A0E0NJE5_ORYRU
MRGRSGARGGRRWSWAATGRQQQPPPRSPAATALARHHRARPPPLPASPAARSLDRAAMALWRRRNVREAPSETVFTDSVDGSSSSSDAASTDEWPELADQLDRSGRQAQLLTAGDAEPAPQLDGVHRPLECQRRKAALPPSPWGDLAHHDAAVVPEKVLFSLLPWFSARSVLSQRGRDLFGQVVELDERESIELRK